MVYVANPSWHIPYSMKLWLNYSNKGFDGGLMQNHRPWGLNYMDVGKNHVDGGRKGGTFMDPWDGGKMSPKVWSIIVWDRFGSVVWLSGCFGSRGSTLRGVTDSLCTEKVWSQCGFEAFYGCLLQFED